MVETGARTEELILELLAPAEREVGARWARREWNVAQEHAATAVVDAILAMLTLDEDVAPSAGRVVIACVEGEWHSLPARMAAELLRIRGWDVVFLGPSVPADDLGDHVRHLAPDLVGLSCSVPLFLKGAQRSIDACLAAGTPVITGGAGFGASGRYAARLGAQGWTSDPRCAADALDAWSLDNGRHGRAAPGDHLELEAARPELVSGAVNALVSGARPPSDGHALAELREAVDTLVTSVECACLVEDSEVVAACVPLVDRLVPDELVGRTSATDLLHHLVPEVRAQSNRAGALAEDALRTLIRRK